MTDLQEVFAQTQARLQEMAHTSYTPESAWHTQNAEAFQKALQNTLSGVAAPLRERVLQEYFALGPLQALLEDPQVSEILVNGPQSIWFECQGRLQCHEDRFLSELTYQNALDRLCEEARCHSTVEQPTTTGSFRGFRLTLIRQEITRSSHHLSLRRHPKNPWTLGKLQEADWASEKEIQFLKTLIEDRKNFLIVGGTGSGKTSLINALLQQTQNNERSLVIEDISEIELPNSACMKLVTRTDPQGILRSVEQSELLRHSLRLRPDRLVMGEIRGDEAKDLLMALATGHGGSFGTLHASDPRQALIRLEMLIQMGAPQWSLSAVRRLIQLSLEYILVVEKSPTGKRKFQGAYRIGSLEENGFLIENLFEIPS